MTRVAMSEDTQRLWTALVAVYQPVPVLRSSSVDTIAGRAQSASMHLAALSACRPKS